MINQINKKFQSKLRQVGGSKMFSVPKEFIESYHLIDDEIYEVAILKKVSSELEIKKYVCKSCNHYFETDDAVPYCPVCECDNLGE